MDGRFRDRTEAGRRLAARLGPYSDRDDVRVLALPRGGVPVAYEVAAALSAPLDVLVVRKVGYPPQPELAMGAVAGGGVLVVNDEAAALGMTREQIERLARNERREVERREREYRDGRPAPALEGCAVLLVDDGLATGSSMRAAVRAVRTRAPARVVVAVPVAPASTCAALAREADEVVCLSTPLDFFAVGEFYEDFAQTSDEEVRSLLDRASRDIAPRAAGRAARPGAERPGGGR